MDRAARRQVEQQLIAAIRGGQEPVVRTSIKALPTDWFLDNFEPLLQAAQASQQYAIMEVLRAEQGAAEEADDEVRQAEASLQASLQAAREAAAQEAAALNERRRMDAHQHVGEATEMEAKRKHAYDPLRRMVDANSDAGSDSGWSTWRSSSSAGSAEANEEVDESEGGGSAWTDAELQDELDDMLDGVTGEILGEYRGRRTSSRGGLIADEDAADDDTADFGPPPEPQTLQLHELSVAQLKQLIRRLGGEDAVPDEIEKREFVARATQLLGQARRCLLLPHPRAHATPAVTPPPQAPLALIDELFMEMGLAGFRPGGEGEGADVLSRWAGADDGDGFGAGAGSSTVLAKAERRIQLHELSKAQLRALLVKLGDTDAGGAHLQMDKRQLLGAAREAMGAAPLVLLDEACIELQARSCTPPSPPPL